MAHSAPQLAELEIDQQVGNGKGAMKAAHKVNTLLGESPTTTFTAVSVIHWRLLQEMGSTRSQLEENVTAVLC